MSLKKMVEIKAFINPKSSFFEHAIEKETLRVSSKGELALTSHPKTFGSPLYHPEITLDFSEAQLELVTRPFLELQHAAESLDEILVFLCHNLNGELLWPSSAPCKLPPEDKIPIANFGTSEKGMEKNMYRLGLKSRYGAKMQMFSGLHYNISFKKEFWKSFLNFSKEDIDLDTFISQKYLHIIRNYFREAWLVSYLFGATPAVDSTYDGSTDLKKIGKDTFIGEHATTLRMSHLGYYVRVACQRNISFNNLDSFIRDLKRAISTDCLKYAKYKDKQLNSFLFQTESELYGRIRAKPRNKETQSFIQNLKQGITYLEIRSLDLNPFYPNTLDMSAFEFLQVFLLYCLFKKSPKILSRQTEYIYRTQDLVALKGREKNLLLFDGSRKRPLLDWGLQILDEMSGLAEQMGKLELIEKQEQKLQHAEKTPSAQVLREIFFHDKSLLHFCLSKANEHKTVHQAVGFSKNQSQKFEKRAKASLQKQSSVEKR